MGAQTAIAPTAAGTAPAPNPILVDAIDALSERRDLTARETAAVLAEIMGGRVSEVQTAGFLTALRTKGETVAELTGLAQTMRAMAIHVPVNRDDLLDTAGTGGGRRTFNVSTTAALVAAGAGCAVAKHGNRSATSLCGSADLLEALDVRIHLEPAAIATCIEELGFGFMFAPDHHRATRHVVPVRKALAVRTAFNLLGPLTNPAGATRQLVGISDASFQDTVAGVLRELGVTRALVVCSEDGLDEMSISAPTQVIEVDGDRIERYSVSAPDVGLKTGDTAAVGGASPAENAAITRRVLAGEPGPARDLVVLNAGAAIYACSRAETLRDGVRAAEKAIDGGAAAGLLERFAKRTRELAAPAR